MTDHAPLGHASYPRGGVVVQLESNGTGKQTGETIFLLGWLYSADSTCTYTRTIRDGCEKEQPAIENAIVLTSDRAAGCMAKSQILSDIHLFIQQGHPGTKNIHDAMRRAQ